MRAAMLLAVLLDSASAYTTHAESASLVAGDAQCKPWCSAPKHAFKPWTDKCGWTACQGCEDFVANCGAAPVCKSWCEDPKHALKDWNMKCNWDNCLGCAE